MARPIEETPILYGEDAKRFLEQMKAAESTGIPREDAERMKRNYALLSGK
jgi:hypothetical protein